jgi:hypothetical protein
MEEMEERSLMGSQVVNSAWEAHRNIEGEEEVELSSKEEQGFPLEEDENEYEKFMVEEEAKRRQFQEQLNLEEEGI